MRSTPIRVLQTAALLWIVSCGTSSPTQTGGPGVATLGDAGNPKPDADVGPDGSMGLPDGNMQLPDGSTPLPDAGSCPLTQQVPLFGMASQACVTCTESACASDVATTESDCSAYSACACACASGDTTCLGACRTDIDTTCQGDLRTLGQCAFQSCQTECAGGMGSPDGGQPPPVDGGPAPGLDGGTCPATTQIPGAGATSAACLRCADQNCASDVSAAESACSAYAACACDCSPGDTACQGMCQGDVNTTCEGAVRTLDGCAAMSCAAECEGGPPPRDGGMTPPGGDAGMACTTLGACCSTLPMMFQGACEMAASGGNENNCQEALTFAQSNGYCQ